MNKNILTAGAIIALGLASAPAVAESVTMTSTAGPSVTIKADDYNLSSAAGVAGLKNRIRAAAADLCQTNAVEPVDVRVARIKCYRTAIANGNWQIDLMVAEQGIKGAKPASASLAGAMR